MERKIYRIMDANFNRAREALRTIEEFCRFVIDSETLAGRAKQMRHQLCSEIGKLDTLRMLAERNSDDDVGKDLQIADPQQRKTLVDCFTAAAKRATEALRVLAETAQIEAPAIANPMERLRFETYTLEKEITEILPRSRFRNIRLYVLIPAEDTVTDRQILDLAQACIDGGADALQLRAKGLTDKRLFDLAVRFVLPCRKGGCLSIINDRADIAALSGADGVHLGQQDLSVEQARKLFFRPVLIGVSTHNEQELRSAIAAGADYVGIGACFSTPTKPQIAVAGMDYVRKALAILKDTSVGHVAIGGITLDTIGLLPEAGVRAAAVSSAVCGAADPCEICRQLKQVMEQ